MKNALEMKVLLSASAFATVTLATLPVYASDTEVYVQSVPADPNNSPTLMMVLDTSGSMDWCMTSDNSCSAPNRRIDVLSSAMKKILYGDAATGVKAAPGFVKMGFARYIPAANKGGWVKYPARPLDAFVEINPNGDVTSPVTAGSGDAIQPLTGSMTSTGNELLIGGPLNQSAGLYFTNLMVPKGATIQEAHIELTADNADSGLSTWEIAVENTATPTDYSSGAISARSYGASTTYSPDTWAAGTAYDIPVTSLVQGISDRTDWCGGNNIAFRIRDIGTIPTTRRAYSFEGAGSTTDNQPKLVVTYLIDPKKTDSCIVMKRIGRSYPVRTTLDDVQWVGTSNSVTYNNSYNTPNTVASSGTTQVAARLQGVAIPPGVTIDRAELVTTVRSNVTVKPTRIDAYKSTNFGAMCTGSSTVTCTRPTGTTTTATTTFPAANTSYSSGSLLRFDVKNIVNELIGQTGWAAGNSMGFRIQNNSSVVADSGTLQIYDATKDPTKAPTLEVDWTETVRDLSKLITARDELANEVTPAQLAVAGGTPLGAAYAEATLYMYGMHTSHDTTGEEAYIDPRTVDSNRDYISPIETSSSKCGANYIFMLTDGDPNDLANVQPLTKQITGNTCSNAASVSGNGKALNWYCMFDLAAFNAKPTNPVGVRLRSNTVLFGPLATDAEANMKQMADLGQGTYYKAGDEAALVNALSDTLNSLLLAGASVAAPGVAVNQMNRLTHLNQLYYAVFDPEPQKSRWDGNLKRYRLDLANSAILDKNGNNAVDTTTGFFKQTSQSFWSAAVDGDKAIEGGAASLLVPDNRTQYTYMGSLTAKNQGLTKIDLSSSTFNSAAKPLVGLSTDNEYYNLMNWYRGYIIPSLKDGLVTVGSGSLLRNRMGAGLHSKPVLINYGYVPNSDSTQPDNQYNYVFFSTMEGTLHAIEAKTGLEKFSFIPGEKLSVLPTLYANSSTTLPEFGMDLPWTVYRKDGNFDNQINGTSDAVYIYGGMRMGGNNYYAMDVTNLNAPKLMWAIDGGSSTDSNRFLRMGQTWSQPVLANIKIGSSVKTVVIFGGGYDPRHETAGQIFTGADLGNQLYIVDALDGTLYWSASGTAADNPYKLVNEMTYSVATAPKVVDMNGDGLSDTIYFGDLGGQLFRVDLDNGQPAASIAKRVRLVAKLGQTVTADVANQRRFYEPATVALFEDKDNINNGNPFAAVAFGSGYRSHPLNESTKDRFFSILDFDVTRADLLSLPETSSSLRAPVTVSDLSKLDPTTGAGADKSKQGWYIEFPDSGEKSMAPGLIFSNQLVFTTYVPTVVNGTNSCTPVIGRTKLYRQCMPYGGIGDTCSWEGDRVQDNVMMGISGEPQYVFQATTSASGATELKGGLVLGAAPPIPLGDYRIYFKSMHRFREKKK
ncbi:PilC-like protein with beta-propeller domain [Fluviicoccus keumensis]|uniref:PilC-like protein with beta-propeller domain n=1 Tax=Fluviicoccus keumensis TaxID=1435465 RepID=A0A4Q7ZA76_9GAMM|nr:PilC/PilY family type IV pilus protein [Fluviicoccus keumensis]RZU47482.1 PilC-like protein with beta-propeller domain [Fluviicoccus keumensis]